VELSSPRSIERGPVEARLYFRVLRTLLYSPRSIERGPVEAPCVVPVARARPCSLRAQLSAAPLKPNCCSFMVCFSCTSPRSIERGPVEAVSTGTTPTTPMCASPRSIERGPVEATSRRPGRQLDCRSPRSIERGPVEAVFVNLSPRHREELSALN